MVTKTIYKFEDLLSLREQKPDGKDFKILDIFGNFDENKKTIEQLIDDDEFVKELFSFVTYTEPTEENNKHRIEIHQKQMIEYLFEKLDTIADYTWPELAATCIFLGANIEKLANLVIDRFKESLNPEAKVINDTKKIIGSHIKDLLEKIQMLKDAGII